MMSGRRCSAGIKIGSIFAVIQVNTDVMKTLVFTAAMLVFFPVVSGAQKIHVVDYSSQADVKVYAVKYESQCDLKVYIVDYASQADEDGHWYFVEYASQADVKICFVEYESQADLKIYYVDYASQAGFRNPNKKHLMAKKHAP